MPDPVHKGSFKDYSFAKVYYAIAGHGRTGVMDIVDETDELLQKQIFFLGGDSSYVKLGPIQESLGQIMLSRGLITEDQLEEVIDETALNQKQVGQVLIEKGVINSDRLHQLLIYQVRLKLISCFSYTKGLFRFREESVGQFNHDVPMYKVNPDEIVYRGVKQHHCIDRLEKEFEFLREKGLRLSRDFERRKENIPFLDEEFAFVKSIGEGKAFSHVIGSSDLGLTSTLKLLYALLVTGMVEVAEVQTLRNVKAEEGEGLRRKTKTIELSEMEKQPAASAESEGGDEEFARLVGDYLSENMEGESGESAETGEEEAESKELSVYEDRQLDISPVAELFLENKQAALQAYLSSRPGEGASRLGEIMVNQKLIDGNQLQEAYKKMREEGTSFLNSLMELGAIKDEDMHTVLSEYFKVPAIKLSELELDQDIVSLVPEEASLKHRVIPINRTGATLVVAMADPSNIEVIDELKFLTGLNIDVVVATENDIKEAINRYHDSAEMLEDVMANFDDSDIEMAEYEDDFDLTTVETDSASTPVVRLVNQILHDALAKGASDVHFEPYEDTFRVRYRIDGVLYHIISPPYKLRNAMVSRIKILAKLNIAERRLPQDGRVSVKMKGKKIDFRVSTLPTLWGEKMVMRILDKENLQLDLTKLGMLRPQLDDFRWAFKQPYGMVLVTGPSGSGKTTTLYSALIELNQISDNVSTAEDPIEYYMEGINQVQMHDDIGLNFAYALRSFLRQDPDTIMVGEIRDFETAEIAVKAALTGHVVLSSVHTNDAPSTVNRLLNMGVEPFLITASLNGVLSQRLVRRLCDNCKEPEEFDKQSLLQVGVPPEDVDDFVGYKAVGCQQCSDRGFKGRLGIYEVMTIKGELTDLILTGATPTELKHEAMERGMVTMRQAGIRKARDGVTTMEEVTRTTMPDFMGGDSGIGE